MPGIASLIAGALEAFNKVFSWKTGGRSSEQNTARKKGEQAHEEFNDALTRSDVDTANRARDEQRRVRDEAASQRP